MREYRGKRLDNGEWVYGYVQLSEDKKSAWICKSKEDDWTVKEQFPVDPETVGQYTGLKDKNGKEIYKGDIIQINHGRNALVVWVQRYLAYYIEWLPDRYGAALSLWQSNQLEVIGNIHDNPELLEG